MRKVLGAIALAAGSIVGLLTATVAPAGGALLEHMHYHDMGTEVLENFCGDLTVRHDYAFHGTFSLTSHGRDRLVYLGDHMRGSESWTNVANGETFTLDLVGTTKDLRVTDNGDGTLTILMLVAGRQMAIAPDGTFLFLDAGTYRTTLKVDDGGTPSDPSDDVEIAGSFELVKAAGHSDTADRDFCTDMHTFIG